ncbi:MAG: hypothetical protein ACTHU0_28560 [Kofleriaceae bacterium]
MIRYQLSWSDTTRGPSELSLWLEVEYRDQPALLQLSGGAAMVAEVLRAFEDAKGPRESSLDALRPMDAIDLSSAMRCWAIEPFSPRLVEGEEVLSRRSPPSMTTEELTVSFGESFALKLLAGLSEPAPFRSYQWEILVGHLEGALYQWSFWRPAFATVEQAARALAPPLADELARELVRLRDLYERTPLERRLVPPTLQPEQAVALASVFVRELDAAAEGYAADEGYEAAIALVPRLHEQLLALGLARA